MNKLFSCIVVFVVMISFVSISDVQSQQKGAGVIKFNSSDGKVVFDPKVVKVLQGSCPTGQKRYYIAEWDKIGFCGVSDDPRCISHFIYVESPNGSTDVKSCEGVWHEEGSPAYSIMGRGKKITGGYACVMNKKDPVFTTPPPVEACPVGTTVGTNVLNNQLQYTCTSECNEEIVPKCPNGYEVITEESWESTCGTFYNFTCGLGGYRYVSQRSDNFAPCGVSGAEVSGNNFETYCCAYTEVPDKILVTGISLDHQNISLKLTQQVKLVAIVSPPQATNKSVVWSSSNNSIITVDQFGNVVAKGIGNAEVTATTVDGNFKAVCKVKTSYVWMP